MALIDIDGFQFFPTASQGYSPSGTRLRVWYNRSFVDSDGVSVQGGSGNTGFFVSVVCSVAGNVVSVPSFAVRSTLDAQDPNPSSIQCFARLYSGGVAKAQIFAFAGTPTGWVIPNPVPATSMTYRQLAIYNQSPSLVNPPLTFLTAQQVQEYFNSLNPAPDASDVTKGLTKLTVPPVVAGNPIAFGANDPNVGDIHGTLSANSLPRSSGTKNLVNSQVTDDGTDVGVNTLNSVQLGDYNYVQNGSRIAVNDNLGRASLFAGGGAGNQYAGIAGVCTDFLGQVYVQATGYSFLFGQAGVVVLGDGVAEHNGTSITIDDVNQLIILSPNLPTSDPAVVGALWNDSGTLKVSAG
jgi:hypothetical protein